MCCKNDEISVQVNNDFLVNTFLNINIKSGLTNFVQAKSSKSH